MDQTEEKKTPIYDVVIHAFTDKHEAETIKNKFEKEHPAWFVTVESF